MHTWTALFLAGTVDAAYRATNGRPPHFGMIMLIWLTFSSNVDVFTQALEALHTANSILTENVGCTFENETARYCDWTPQNWHSTQMLSENGLTLVSSTGSGNYVYVVKQESPSNLTSPLTRATGENTDCLEFYFFVTGVNATLMVSIQREGYTTAMLWRYVSNNYNNATKWPTSSLPLKSHEDFRVIIESQPTNDMRSVIAVDNIKHLRNRTCALAPTGAEVDQTTSSSTSTPRLDIVSSSIQPTASITDSGAYHPVAPLASTSPPDTPSDKPVYSSATYPNAGPTGDDREKKSDNNTAVLAGAVTAGVVLLVIILVIAGVVIWKRRPRENKKIKDCEITNDQGNDSTIADSSSDLNTGTGRPHLSSSNHTIDSGYSDVAPVGLELDYSCNPYNLAGDEAVGITHFKMTPLVDHNQDEYSVLGILVNKVTKTYVTENDNYSHINNIQPAVSDVSALYSQVKMKGKSVVAEHRLEPDESPLYTEVKKNGKPATSSGNRLRTGSATRELNSHQTGSLAGFRSADCSVRLSPENNDAVSSQPAAECNASAVYAQVQKKGRGVSSEAKTSDADVTAFYNKEKKPKQKPVIAKKPTISNTPTTADN